MNREEVKKIEEVLQKLDGLRCKHCGVRIVKDPQSHVIESQGWRHVRADGILSFYHCSYFDKRVSAWLVATCEVYE